MSATGSGRPARILVVDDDAANVAVLRRMLERSGYDDIVTTQDSRAVMGLFEQFRPDLVLLDLHMPPPDGHALLVRLRDVIDPGDLVPIIVLTADASFDAKERALGAGAHDFVTKPFHFPELALRVRNALALRARHRELKAHDEQVTSELALRVQADHELAARWQQSRRRIEEILAGSGLSMAFQPIVDLTDGTIVGTEALSRFSSEPRRGPDAWFAEAAEVALAVDLELRAVALALRAVEELPDDAFLSVNASAETIMSHGFADLLSTVDPSRLVVELTEHEQVEDYSRLTTMLGPMRSRGLRLAVDDTGSGWSSLQHILQLAPDIIKLDRELIVGVDADPGRRALIASMLHFAAEMGSVVVAEGIETVPELTTLCDLGVRNGQGYLMAQPAPLPLHAGPFAGLTEDGERRGVGAHRVLQRAVDVLCEQSDSLDSLPEADAADLMRMQLRETITACRRVILEIDEMVAGAAPVIGGGCRGGGEQVDYRAVFEQSPAQYMLLDPDLRILDCSDAYLAATLTERESVVGRHLFEVFPDNPDDPGADGVRNLQASLDRVLFQKVADDMPLQKYDVRRPDAEGGGFEQKWWACRNVPVLSPAGKLEAILHRAEDVTDLVRLRETLDLVSDGEEPQLQAGERRGDGLTQSLFLRGRELERANDRLVELDRVKSEFLSRMSHELRTPLNAVIGFAQVLGMDDLSPPHADIVHDILKAGRHLLDLINEVLDISQIEAGRMNLSIEPVQLRDVLSTAAQLAAPIADRAGIPVEVEVVSGGLYAMADRQRLLQILLNLLSNAVKYNRPDGRVVVRSEVAGDRLRIFVVDRGYGIAPADRPRLFEPFDRLGQELTDIEGTGVGLTLARGLAERMRCSLELHESSPDGSTFVVDMPLTTPPSPRQAAPRGDAAAADVEAAEAERTPVTILYIEDNLSNLRLVDAVLGRLPNVRLLTAMQGRLGVELAVVQQPDLVLLDVHLPDVNGREVLQLLRADPKTEKTRVVFLSADATPHHIERLLGEGADGYLTKPLDVAELMEVVEAARPA